jgi:hypothetical protein
VCGDRGCEWDKQHTDPTCRLTRKPPCDPKGGKKDERCQPPGPPSQRSEASSANSFRFAGKLGLFGRRRRAR